ncbi:MAG TPA: P1 family peptidase [Bryobacteraceae bacterium]|nr:P1 family peptidase [Bryobacteraceae bacterium]
MVLPIRVIAAFLVFLSLLSGRARQLGVPFDGTPGPLNAITDVAGIEVGQTTLISGGGKEAVRTGVTAVWPRGKDFGKQVFGGWFSLNGNGEMTGTTWVEESGLLEGPVMITNTHSVGLVRDSYIKWRVARARKAGIDLTDEWSLPVVAETWDGFLNDVNGFHVREADVFAALESAKGGPVTEGNVGGGTGMVCYGFKGGIGTSSRKAGPYTVGVLVQCNCGRRPQLRIAGVPVGQELPGSEPYAANFRHNGEDVGSIIIVVATDAPLLPHQMKRLARRASLGLARTGSTSGNGSGDIFIAFSTANAEAGRTSGLANLTMMPNDEINPIFEATVQATEEAVVNAMVGADNMTGYDGHTVTALPHDRLQQVLEKYKRLEPHTAGR